MGEGYLALIGTRPVAAPLGEVPLEFSTEGQVSPVPRLCLWVGQTEAVVSFFVFPKPSTSGSSARACLAR